MTIWPEQSVELHRRHLAIFWACYRLERLWTSTSSPAYATTTVPSHPRPSSPYSCTHAQHALLLVCLDDFSWWRTHSYGSESWTTSASYGHSSKHSCHPWQSTLKTPWYHYLCGKASKPLHFVHDDFFGMPLRLDAFGAFWSSLTSVKYIMSQKNFAISVTWDVQIDPDELDLRWHDSSGDTFGLRNTNLCHILHTHRPQCRQQDTGTLFPPRPFTDFNQQYIMLHLAIEPFPLGTYHKMLDRRKIPSIHVVLQFPFYFFLLPCCCLVCIHLIPVSALFSSEIWQNETPQPPI